MQRNQPLSDEKLEGQAHELAGRIRQRVDEDILALARLLVSKEDRDLFGDTEFEARDIVHRIGAQAFEEHLKKRMATSIPESTVPDADKTPCSKATGPKHS